MAELPTPNVLPASVDPWQPAFVEIVAIHDETPGVRTFDLAAPHGYSFEPGQFNMLYVPGYGEAAISISSHPESPQVISHTIRRAGNVTGALFRCQPGDRIGLRGPFGSSWPVGRYRGANVVIAAGGIGLAPLRPAIHQLVSDREEYGRVAVVYGSRHPKDLLYRESFDQWRRADIEVLVTVDFADDHWTGPIGVVPTLLEQLPWIGPQTTLWTCGPEIMMRFTAQQALRQGVTSDHLYLSLERNMNCALGLCGHCQFGPSFVCKDGPVYAYPHIAPFLFVHDF
ncbi:MAG TPA: Ni/Fe hydrogenase subunit gamma [Planctomycetaceae bacterium]|nr:Ni/Fe hydrogenase subunit gamma [Planctomycetaceae bacterium]